MNVRFYRITSYTWNCQYFTCVITILVKFDIYFLGLPWKFFFRVTTDDLLHVKPLENVKRNAIFFKLFWYKVFVHLKLKLLNFLVDSVLILGFPSIMYLSAKFSRAVRVIFHVWFQLDSLSTLSWVLFRDITG